MFGCFASLGDVESSRFEDVPIFFPQLKLSEMTILFGISIPTENDSFLLLLLILVVVY